MKKTNMLSHNLISYQKARGLSNVEFANELCIGESTLRAIRKNGNTTLDTLMRISDAMGVSLDLLVHDADFSDKMFILKYMASSATWVNKFSEQQIAEISEHIAAIWEIIGKE